jgi:hypothetical protein
MTAATAPHQATCAWCGATPTRLYAAGPLCAAHQPPLPPIPRPGTTLADLRTRAADRTTGAPA